MPASSVQAPLLPPPPPGNSLNGQPIEPLPPAEPAPPADGAVPAAPSAFSGNPSRGTVAVAHYDPATGKYMTPDGRLEQQTNLIAGAASKSWQDLLPT
jgi:hypothetical protein